MCLKSWRVSGLVMFLCSSKLPDLCLHRYLILADNESLVTLPSCFLFLCEITGPPTSLWWRRSKTSTLTPMDLHGPEWTLRLGSCLPLPPYFSVHIIYFVGSGLVWVELGRRTSSWVLTTCTPSGRRLRRGWTQGHFKCKYFHQSYVTMKEFWRNYLQEQILLNQFGFMLIFKNIIQLNFISIRFISHLTFTVKLGFSFLFILCVTDHSCVYRKLSCGFSFHQDQFSRLNFASLNAHMKTGFFCQHLDSAKLLLLFSH